jgi:hypothetical protein
MNAPYRMSTLAAAQHMAGDAELKLLHSYVAADLPKVDEQIEKNTGAQHSAESLTWSYANILGRDSPMSKNYS